ncbi:Unconventional myosin-X [Phytophthora cinnamomi]|uniref:Unconventional myosin-X n=1 Tax=Phytophthora cinnamomi TaxID=4785 RepID=UPI003559E82B|nr:Unconventional myosin-X [Phytophthora cinnamomi]
MGKSTNNALSEQEVTKLQAQLHQSAQDTLTYLEALKHNLGEYDHKNHLHHSNSATSFFDDGLDHAKEAVKQLRHVADHLRKDAGVTDVDAARSAMEQAFNALTDLHKVANAFDTEHPTPSKHGDKKPTTSETVEWLVSTTRDSTFTGFAPLQRQIIEAQVAFGDVEKPSIKARAKEAVHQVANKIDSKLDKIKGKSSPKAKDEQLTEASAHSA